MSGWESWVRPLVLAAMPAAAAGLVAWGAMTARIAEVQGDLARVELRLDEVADDARDVERGLGALQEARQGDLRVLQTALSAIDRRLARIEQRLDAPRRGRR